MENVGLETTHSGGYVVRETGRVSTLPLLSRLWRALNLHPSPDAAQSRLQQRMIVRTMRVGMVTDSLVLLLFLLNRPEPRPEWVLAAVMLPIFLLLHELAMRGHVQGVAGVTILLMLGLVAFSPLLFKPIPSLPFFAIIPLMLTGIFFSWQCVIASTIGLSAWLILFHLFSQPEQGLTMPLIEPIALYIGVAGAIVVFVQHRDELEQVRLADLNRALEQVRASEATLEARVAERTRALLQSEQRFANLFYNDIIPLCICKADRNDPRVIEVNDPYLRMTGFTREEVIGESLLDLGIIIPSPARDARIEAFVRDGGYKLREIQIRRRDGEIRTVLISAQLIQLGGETFSYEGLLDITEQRRAEAQQFEIALQKERMRLLQLFIQEASHEFRTPLAVMSTSLHLMSRMTDPAAMTRYIPRIAEQIDRLKRLLEGMVALTTLESGVPLEMQPIDVPTLIGDTLKNAETLLMRHTLTTDTGTTARIMGDPYWLELALHELLRNAAAHTPPGGTIAIQSSMCTTDRLLGIVVEDSGAGIPPEALPHIFTHFWRADSAHSTPGFGLGLSIVQRVAQLHGGEIRVESQVGQGSRFTLVLPLAGEGAAQQDE
jgi:PAS domain S-box-containing protein